MIKNQVIVGFFLGSGMANPLTARQVNSAVEADTQLIRILMQASTNSFIKGTQDMLCYKSEYENYSIMGSLSYILPNIVKD
jgi:hypothetical protein